MKKLFFLICMCCVLSACSANNSAREANSGETGLTVADENKASNGTTYLQQEDIAPEAVALHEPVDIDKDGDIIEIKEKFFIAQTNDMYINTEDYLGKTIKYQGIFDIFYWDAIDENIYYVIRYGPGCCGYDDNAGFEVVWDGDYPEQDDWVEAVGTLEVYEETYDGYAYQFLRLRLSSLTVLEERGKEFVTT